MTGKRFIFHSTEIEDTLETDVDHKYTSCNKDGFQDLCEMLNELAEENEQLKQLIKETLEITPIEHSLAIKLKNSIREMYE